MNCPMPIVSIVVLTYNQQDTITLTLNSILEQECDFPFEIIIGEDASSDLTRSIVLEYAEAHPEVIKVLEKAPNKGILKNYLDALSTCRGKYIAQCSGDDFWHNRKKLQKQIDFLEQHPDYGFVHSEVDVLIEDKARTIKNINSYNGLPTLSDHLYLELLAEIKTVYSPSVMFRKELLNYVDFNEFIANGYKMEDLPMILEFSAHTKCHYIPESLATYRINDGSLCRPETRDKKQAFLDSIYKVQLHYYHKYYQEKFDINKIHYAHKARYMQMYQELDLNRSAYQISKELATLPVNKSTLIALGHHNYSVFMVLNYLTKLKKTLKNIVS
jgi:glycosyltransferase involved in cell wall biosynthesis